MHEDGFNDCLKFVEAGNAVNPVRHTIVNYRAEELERLEKEQPVSDANLKRLEGVTESTVPVGTVPEAEGAIGKFIPAEHVNPTEKGVTPMEQSNLRTTDSCWKFHHHSKPILGFKSLLFVFISFGTF